MIEWTTDPDVRRRALVGLNKGEAHHALKRAINFHQRGELRDRTGEGQHYRVAGLNLLAAIIIYWNTLKLGDAVFATDARPCALSAGRGPSVGQPPPRGAAQSRPGRGRVRREARPAPAPAASPCDRAAALRPRGTAAAVLRWRGRTCADAGTGRCAADAPRPSAAGGRRGVDRLGVDVQLQGREPQDLLVDLQRRLLGESAEHTHEGDLRTHPGSAPTVKQHLAAIRMLGDWLVVSQVLPVNPARPSGGRQLRAGSARSSGCGDRTTSGRRAGGGSGSMRRAASGTTSRPTIGRPGSTRRRRRSSRASIRRGGGWRAGRCRGVSFWRWIKRRAAAADLPPSTCCPTARRERQHPVPPVERLNGGLLVNAEHGGMTGRVQVETDDVGGLRLEVGVVRRHVAGQPVRPQVRLAPDPLYDVHPNLVQRRSRVALSTIVSSEIPSFSNRHSWVAVAFLPADPHPRGRLSPRRALVS